jgi:HK97 family phage portal protein
MANRVIDFISRAFKGQQTQNISENYPMVGMQNVAGINLQEIIPAMYQAWGAYGYQPSQTWYQLATMYNSWVYTAIEKKARTLATLPPKLYRYEKIATGKTIKPHGIKAVIQAKGLYMTPSKEAIHAELKQMGVKRVEIDDHPFLDIVNKPNPDMVRFNFWHLMGIHLELNGAVAIYKAKYFLGAPTELHILPTTWTGQMKPIPTAYGIGGFKLIDQNLMENFTKEEIIWPHYVSLKNPFEGMSALKAQLYSYNLDQYLQQQMIAFFKNNTMFSSVFKTKDNQPLSAAAYNQVMASLKNYQGPKTAFQPFLLNGLEMEKTLNTTAKDSMIAEIEKFSRDKMLSAHDVSAGKVGLVESQNRANLDAVNQNYFNEAIKPMAMLITEYFDRYLVPEFDDRLDFEFDTPHFVDRAVDIQERESNLRSGVTTINEERQKIGLENDESLNGVRFIPRGMLAIRDGKVVQELEPTQAAPSWGSPAGGGEPPVKPIIEPKPEEGKALTTKDTKFWTPERKAIAYKKFVKNVTPYEKEFKAAMSEHFAWVEKECVKLLEKSGVKIKANTGAMTKQHRAEWLKENKAKFDELLPAKTALKKDLKERLKPIYQKTLAGGGQNRIDEFAGKLDGKKLFTKADDFDDIDDIKFNINDPKVKQWLGDRLEEF